MIKPNKDKVKIYITEYATTKGIIEYVPNNIVYESKDQVFVWEYMDFVKAEKMLFEGRGFRFLLSDAVNDALAVRQNEVEALNKKLTKLQRLDFYKVTVAENKPAPDNYENLAHIFTVPD